jgi:hypothetical protein
MFEHPALKGKKVKKVKKLSFNFVDDTALDEPIDKSSLEIGNKPVDTPTQESWTNSFE